MKCALRPRFEQALPFLLPAIAAFIVYFVTLWGGYVYDDVMVVHDDVRLHDPHQWNRYWTSDYFDGGIDNLYRPLVSTSYAVEWFIHGDRPWIFHAINLLLHALVAGLVGELIRRAIADPSLGLNAGVAGGLLFAVHPVHVEAVANIVGRAELACTAGILAGLVLLCRPLSVMRIISVLFVGVIALLSKEQGILQPLLWLMFCFLIPAPKSKKRVNLFTLLTCWIWAAYLIWREHILKFEWDRSYMDPTVQPLIHSLGADRILMPVVLLGHYIALLIWPAHLAVDYGADAIGAVAHFSDPYLWMGLLTTLTLGILILWTFATKRYFTLFCLLAFCITYGVIGNIITLIGTIFAERLIYLPSVFLLMIGGVAIGRLPVRIRVAVLALLVTAGSVRSVIAARNWNHPVELFESGLAAQPKSIQLHFLLSRALHDAGKPAQAQQVMKQVCDLYPAYWRVWVFRSLEEMDDGDFADAQRDLDHAMKLQKHPKEIEAAAHLQELEAATKPAASTQ